VFNPLSLPVGCFHKCRRQQMPVSLIAVIKSTPEEIEDQDHLDLARIVFGFNHSVYGRLRQLIDVLNEL
jgi:hypothetical protein